MSATAAVVGAGLSGATAAAVLRAKGWRVEVFESRGHLAGNCFDASMYGVTVHHYGPHCFHTNSDRVWRFLNRYTRFNDFQLRVVADTARGRVALPLTRRTVDALGGLDAQQIRELVFRDYSEKQWGVPLERLGGAVLNRVPLVREADDDRYFTDRHQGIPAGGYTAMVAAMLDGCRVHLGCGADDWRRHRRDLVVYTGPLDAYFGHALGRLGYRSLRFEHRQEARRRDAIVNQCNRLPYTRSYDHSHWLGQDVRRTVVTYEHPEEYEPGGGSDPFYPKPFGPDQALAERYRALARREPATVFTGRLARYTYLNMDAAVAAALSRLETL